MRGRKVNRDFVLKLKAIGYRNAMIAARCHCSIETVTEIVGQGEARRYENFAPITLDPLDPGIGAPSWAPMLPNSLCDPLLDRLRQFHPELAP